MLGVYVQVHNEEVTAMALSDSALSEPLDAVRVGDGTDLVRELAQRTLEQLIEAEASAKIGAGRYERSEARRPTAMASARRRCRPRLGTSSWGSRSSARARSSPPSWSVERRRRIEQALYAVIMEAYVNGVSTRSARWSPGPWWWPPGSAPVAPVRCSGSASATARTRPSGPGSCAHARTEASPGSALSSPTLTPA